jgi:hypothetical protein
MPLGERDIEAAEARTRPYKLADGGGLTLLVQPTGAKWWRFRYRVDGREKMLSLGTYPDVPVRKARQLRDDARSLLAEGVDPSLFRVTNPRVTPIAARGPLPKATSSTRSKVDRKRATVSATSTAWLDSRRKGLGDEAVRRYRWVLDLYIVPQFGRRSIRSLRGEELLALVDRAEASEHPETAKRIRQTIKQLIRYSAIHDLIDYSIAARLYAGLR